jgi:DNA polymerase/3'-5' exonuclease PolX
VAKRRTDSRRARAERLLVVRRVRVIGSRGAEYEVSILENGKARCECTAFKYRRDCRHVRSPDVKDAQNGILPARHTFEEVLLLARVIQSALAPYCRRVEIVGSLRRRRQEVKDIDLIFVPGAWSVEQVVELFRSFGAPVHRGERMGSIVLPQGIPAQLWPVEDDENWGAALLNWTGPTDFEIGLRVRANKRGWKFSQHGLVERATGRHIAGATEEDVFRALDLPWIPPELRERDRRVEPRKTRRKEPP